MKRIPIVLLFAFILLTSFSSVPLPTKLQVTVIDHLGNIVEGATVELYGTETDYRKEENPIQEALTTDKKGRATFKDLEEQVYWLHVYKGDMNNDGAGVQTGALVPKKVNKVNVVIE